MEDRCPLLANARAEVASVATAAARRLMSFARSDARLAKIWLRDRAWVAMIVSGGYG